MLLDWGFIPAALLAVVVSVVFSLMMSIASWRFRGDFFVLISLAIQVMIFTVLKNWHDSSEPVGTWGNMTNGDFGLIDVPSPNLFGYIFDDKISVAILYSAFALGAVLISRVLLESPWGPYVGAGIGIARVGVESDAQTVRLTTAGRSSDVEIPKMSGNDTVFAYQLLAGVGFVLTEKTELRAGYRYLASEDTDIDGEEGTNASHNLEAGVLVTF